MKTAVLFYIFAASALAATPAIKECGRYAVTGTIQCKSAIECSIIAWEKSASQTEIRISPVKNHLLNLRGKPVQLDLIFDSAAGYPLTAKLAGDKFAFVNATNTAEDVRLKEKHACK